MVVPQKFLVIVGFHCYFVYEYIFSSWEPERIVGAKLGLGNLELDKKLGNNWIFVVSISVIGFGCLVQ